MARDAGENSEQTSSAERCPIPAHVLVVEDSLIIAMDTEDSLRSLGVETVTTAGSVSAALASIEQDPPGMAILDYMLGPENSDPVAEVLRQRGIPFVLASGYGELADDLLARGAFALLDKPYGRAEIEDMLARRAV